MGWFVGGKGEGHSMLKDRRRKGSETNSGKSATSNLEADSIRSRAENTGGCVNLKTELTPSLPQPIKYPRLKNAFIHLQTVYFPVLQQIYFQ